MQFDGQALEKARGGLSREKLAARAGISSSYVFRLEAGTSEPSASIAANLAKALDVPLVSLFRDTEAVA